MSWLDLILLIALIAVMLWFHTFLWSQLFGLNRMGDELHYATTSDGWHLALHRYRPRERRFTEPVVLWHGMGTNRYNFDLADDCSLARTLKDRGFDVWAVELRGAGLSSRPSWSWTEKWRFDFDDYLRFDVPAALQSVQELSGSPTVFWIGHSLGGLLGYIWTATHGDSGVRGLVALAAPVQIWHSRWLALLRPLVALMAIGRSVPFRSLACCFSPFFGWLPYTLARLFLFPGELKPTQVRRLLVNEIEDTSSRLIRQFLRWGRRRRFESSDGSRDYFSLLRKIREPVLVLAADKDNLATPAACTPAYEQIGGPDKQLRQFGKDRGDDADFGHADILQGRSARDIVYPEIVQWLEARASVCGSLVIQRSTPRESRSWSRLSGVQD